MNPPPHLRFQKPCLIVYLTQILYTDKIVLLFLLLIAYPVDQAPYSDNNSPASGSDIDEIRTTRTKRQNSWSMVSGPCLTARGTLGKCTSFRSCYPYIKFPDYQLWESWVVGMYDTCTYISHDHRQVNQIDENRIMLHFNASPGKR